jgi:hypothetical protein
MAAQSADANERAAIRRFAADQGRVRVTKTTQYDLLGRDLTTEDICREITSWIDGGYRIKKVILRGQHVGAPALEMKPRVDDTLFYLKVALCDLDSPDEYMLLISDHPDH